MNTFPTEKLPCWAHRDVQTFSSFNKIRGPLFCRTVQSGLLLIPNEDEIAIFSRNNEKVGSQSKANSAQCEPTAAVFASAFFASSSLTRA